MNLYYDRISKMFTLEVDDGADFLGPMTHALVKLRKDYDLTPSQAREALLRAVFNNGDAVPVEDVKKMAALIK